MLLTGDLLYERLQAQSHNFHKVVDFNPKEKLLKLDFTEANTDLSNVGFSDYKALSFYINKKLTAAKAKFGIGGYNEDRALYKSHELFKSGALKPAPFVSLKEGRTVHLGVDIWGEEGTKVYAPLGGMVHSFAFNDNAGDYGATIILMHQLDTLIFYTLYGHLSLEDIARVSEFQYIIRGHVIGHFGKPEENGQWPPHLHFQVIKDMRMHKGDYPGVCTLAERDKYLANCPDPNVILNIQMLKE